MQIFNGIITIITIIISIMMIMDYLLVNQSASHLVNAVMGFMYHSHSFNFTN